MNRKRKSPTYNSQILRSIRVEPIKRYIDNGVMLRDIFLGYGLKIAVTFVATIGTTYIEKLFQSYRTMIIVR